jgi:hypothetical protein
VQIMPYRYETLERVVRGYQATGVPLVGTDGRVFTAEPFVDAGIGLYYLVPWIARTLHVSVDAALRIWSVSAVAAAGVLGLVGSLLLFRSAHARLAAALGMGAVLALCLRFGEGYLAGGVAVVATVPLFLHLRRSGRPAVLPAFLFAAGVLAGVADEVRSLIGTPVLLFVLLVLALDAATPRGRRLLCAGALLLGTALPRVYAHRLAGERDDFVRAAAAGRLPGERGEAMWHPAYIGLGYLPNRHGITYSDESAIAKVRAVDPRAPYLSPRYTAILRGEVFRIAREDPGLVARTVAAKGFRILLFLALFANVGLTAALAGPRNWRLEVPFAAATALAAVPGVVGLPVLHYVVGALAFAALYGAVSLEARFAAPVPVPATPRPSARPRPA